MSENTEDRLSRLYQEAPRLDSPDELDQKILAEASKRAPVRQKRNMISGWIPALTTACVAGLVVVITGPFFEQPAERTGVKNISRQAEQEERVEPEEFAASQSAEGNVNQAKTQSSQHQADNESHSGASMAEVAEPARTSIDTSSVPGTVLMDSAAPAAPPNQELLPNKSEEAYSTESGTSLAIRKRASLSATEINLWLTEIRQLAENVGEAEAQAMLEQLISQCNACGLPGTVAELRANAWKLQ